MPPALARLLSDRRVWVLIVALIAGGYQAVTRPGNAPDPSGRSPGPARAVQRAPGPHSGPSRNASPSAGQDAEDESPSLATEERHGGHLIKKHVGQTPDELRARLAREPDVSAASSFTDLPTAETAVAAAIRAERGRIDRWLAGGEPRLVFNHRFDREVGITLRRGDNAPRAARGLRLVLVRDRGEADGWRLLTGYPVP